MSKTSSLPIGLEHSWLLSFPNIVGDCIRQLLEDVMYPGAFANVVHVTL